MKPRPGCKALVQGMYGLVEHRRVAVILTRNLARPRLRRRGQGAGKGAGKGACEGAGRPPRACRCWPPLRGGALRCSQRRPRRETRYARCASCARTVAASQKYEARCARRPAPLRSSAAHRRARDGRPAPSHAPLPAPLQAASRRSWATASSSARTRRSCSRRRRQRAGVRGERVRRRAGATASGSEGERAPWRPATGRCLRRRAAQPRGRRAQRASYF